MGGRPETREGHEEIENIRKRVIQETLLYKGEFLFKCVQKVVVYLENLTIEKGSREKKNFFQESPSESKFETFTKELLEENFRKKRRFFFMLKYVFHQFVRGVAAAVFLFLTKLEAAILRSSTRNERVILI